MDKPTTLKWSRVLNRPVEADPTTDTMSTNIPPTLKSALPMVTGEAQDISIEDPKTMTMTDKYYEVLNPEQDDVVFISHSHIMNTTCTVELERLSDDTQYMYKAGRLEPSLQSSSMESTETSDSVTPKKKPCYQPKRKPSKARIRAQKITVEQKKNKSLLTKPAHCLPLSKPPSASNMQSKVEDAVPTTQDSSDDTIIYTPPSSPVKKNKKK